MPSAKEIARRTEAAEILAAAEVIFAPFSIHTGTAIITEIVIGPDAADAQEVFDREEAKALKTGHIIVHADGRRVWRESVPIVDTSEGLSASERYEWHADGDRVRHLRVEHTLHPDGRHDRKTLRRFWRIYE